MNVFLDILTLAGYVIEIIGIVMMANRFMAVDILSLIIGIILAPFRSGMPSMIARLSENEPENAYRTFRGLSFLAWGFSFQLISFVAENFLL